jgi:hypothetical protein
MNDPGEIIPFIIDARGLREVVTTKSNSLKALCLDMLLKGAIAVPICVWDEFEDAYEDEADGIAASVTKKISMNKRYNAGAAKAAETLNSGFSLTESNWATDFFAASIAMTDGYTIITIPEQQPFYAKLPACKSLDINLLWTV